MDLSKLPRLSKTEPPEPMPTDQAPADAGPRRGAFCDRCGSALRPAARFCDSCGTPVAGAPVPVGSPAVNYADRDLAEPLSGIGFDVWFSLIIGLIFTLLGRTYGQYLLSKLSGRTFSTGVTWMSGPKAGQEVAYAELDGNPMLSDASMFLFGAALLLDAAGRLLVLSRLPGRTALLGLALAAMVGAVGYNAYVSIKLVTGGVIPIISLVCVAFGGYVLFQQWMTLRAVLAMNAAQKSAPGAGKTPGAQGR